ncbi:MAG: N-6 DNA methylase [Vicinamibacterales bacterium]
MSLSSAARKTHGAFYTPEDVAEFLTRWAIRTPGDSILDPSAGDGVFLAAAGRILPTPSKNHVRGIEVLETTCRQTTARLEELGVACELRCADFFDVTPRQHGMVDAVVGNPPFIRYHRFTGDSRMRALSRAREAGVAISALTSSWAPFLVHAITFIRHGGRLAVVAPGELAHAAYAVPVLQFLCESFRSIEIVAFDRRVFAELGEDTVLVLADGKGQPLRHFKLHRLQDASELPMAQLEAGVVLDAPAVAAGAVRMLEYLLPKATRELYSALRSHARVSTLGALATVGIGYVTGANDFFHLSTNRAKQLDLPRQYLAEAVRSGSDLRGTIFKVRDWRALADADGPNLLLLVPPVAQHLPPALERYFATGVRQGIHRRYKCRVRSPWYSVPHVRVGDAFLTYMSGAEPRFVVNAARVRAPNTLHVVRLKARAPVSARSVATSWRSSLSALSCELEGHSLGGGMLKLEPSEAERVLIARVTSLRELRDEVDRLVRTGEPQSREATRLVDGLTRNELGLSRSDMLRLQEGVQFLRHRRANR